MSGGFAMADVFISYARADWQHAKRLADDLGNEGYQVWWDVELVGSDNFRDVIMEELAAAKAVIVVWSPASSRSGFVMDEAGRALRSGKLISTRLDDFPAESIPLGFGSQHCDKFSERACIIRALAKCGIDTAVRKSAAEQARLKSETAFWDEIAGSSDAAYFQLYLDEYPNGLHRAHAKLRQRQLKAAQPGLIQGYASLISFWDAALVRQEPVEVEEPVADSGDEPPLSDLWVSWVGQFALLTPITVS
jgi:hypothetical protein